MKLELLGCVEIEPVISYLINGIFMQCQSSKEAQTQGTHRACKSPKNVSFDIFTLLKRSRILSVV